MAKSFKKHDMTLGNPLKVLLLFAVPMFLGQIFQQFYNVADMKIVGMKLGDNALAAISSVSSVFGILMGVANGLNNGCAITVARMYGADNKQMLRRTLASMLCINFTAVALFSIVGISFMNPLMALMKVPENLKADAKVYLTFILCGMITTMAYNMCASVLRSVGNSRTPLYFLIGSSIVNVTLDYLFVVKTELGVGGAAAATIIAQGISALLCLGYIIKYVPELHISKKDFVFDKVLLKELLAMGFSMSLITSLVSFGSAAVNRANNILSARYGEGIITANSAARRIDGLIMMPMSTLGMALSTFVSQNRGAGHYERINRGIKGALSVGAAWCALGVACLYAFGDFLVKFITGTDSETVTVHAVEYMRINSPFFFLLMVLLVFRSVLQGFGKKIIPIVTAAAELVLKFFAAAILVPHLGFLGICVAEPVIWTVSAIIVAAVYIKDMKSIKKQYNF
ncbi:MAG: MATE family efflux transporter [Ruminococcaceae bacterium]|nr:MATE family efflux transporter [Oscillospiraceae bacterium]